MDKKITIAIDGFSSTGKSTLAKQLARHLGYAYVDTGAMYRAVTYYAMDKGYITDEHFDKQALINDLPHISLQFLFSPEKGFAEMYINEHNVEKMIRTLAVSNKVSRVAELSEVRAMLVKQQQQMGAGKGVVMDGRDIGTVVFPDAELKLFMTASPETRAKRRYLELQEKGDKASYEEVLKNVQERDYIDCNRQDSPLVKAADAIEIDNSKLSIEEQFEKVMQLVQNAV
ncbi:(d)CMP kinase [Flavobacterium sp. D11R37]|uniref:(d)CMP kinase n=1 Tax=Flavobacterium coralii TaxID=2838017 RepID=UPI001CA69E81|nr:(d)CMP kinase [Flavobacterium coralii]MBY8961717.1 (d)CMP kinase [Flavobacterium coralii]